MAHTPTSVALSQKLLKETGKAIQIDVVGRGALVTDHIILDPKWEWHRYSVCWPNGSRHFFDTLRQVKRYLDRSAAPTDRDWQVDR